MLAMRLFTDQDTLGSLNLYASAADAFDEDDRSVASIVAAHAAVALRAAQQQQQLEDQVESDDVEVIGVAKGLLMARQGIDSDAALEQMRETAHRLDRRLLEVANQLIEGDQLR